MRPSGLAMLAAVGAVLVLMASSAAGQGFEFAERPSTLVLGARKAQDELSTLLSRSSAFIRQYSTQRKSVCSASGGSRRSLCAAGGGGDSADDALMIAASPQVYDSRLKDDTGVAPLVSTPKEQGECTTCVAFVIAGAAEAAVASALGKPASQYDLSEMQLHKCPADPKAPRSICLDATNLRAALTNFVDLQSNGQLVDDKCMPYSVKGLESDSACKYSCQDLNPDIKGGAFKYKQIRGLADAQNHIRKYGSILSPLEIYDDMRPFFAKNPKGVYPGHGPNAKLMENHAILIIGYDNANQAWICRNSWGPGFADGGFFKVKFGADSVAVPGETYGIWFEPESPPAMKGPSPDPTKPGCYLYRTVAGDYVTKLADRWGIPIGALLADNPQDQLIGPALRAGAFLKPGTLLSVCGEISTGGPAGPAPEEPVPDASSESSGGDPDQDQAPAPAPIRRGGGGGGIVSGVGGLTNTMTGGLVGGVTRGVTSGITGGVTRGVTSGVTSGLTGLVPVGYGGSSAPVSLGTGGIGVGGSIPSVGGFGLGRKLRK